MDDEVCNRCRQESRRARDGDNVKERSDCEREIDGGVAIETE